MSNRDFDAFGDIINSQTGIFGEESAGIEPGLATFDKARTVATPNGVVVEMHCRGCGRPVSLTVEYPELVAIKYGVPPHVAFRGQQGIVSNPTEWAYSPREQAWWPNMPCAHCRTPCAPLVTPEEAESHLAKARRNAWVNPAGEQRVAQISASAAERVRAAQAATAERR